LTICGLGWSLLHAAGFPVRNLKRSALQAVWCESNIRIENRVEATTAENYFCFTLLLFFFKTLVLL